MRLALVLGGASLVGCAATHGSECTGIDTMGLDCDARLSSLSASEWETYCRAFVAQYEGHGVGEGEALNCGGLRTWNTTVELCTSLPPGGPCPVTVGRGLRCTRAWLDAWQALGDACVEWPAWPADCVHPEEGDWLYCNPYYDGGASDGGVSE